MGGHGYPRLGEMDCSFSKEELITREFGQDYSLTIKDLKQLHFLSSCVLSIQHELKYRKLKGGRNYHADRHPIISQAVIDSYAIWCEIINEVRENYQAVVMASPDLIEQEHGRCSGSFTHWMNVWVNTVDPRRAKFRTSDGNWLSADIPFILFDAQEKYFEYILGCIEDGENSCTVKSRDYGMSWGYAALDVYKFLYWANSISSVASSKEAQLDSGKTKATLFGKMRHILFSLPEVMRPSVFQTDKNKRNPFSTHLSLINPDMDSEIRGESGNNIGEGSRATDVFVDEIGIHENPEGIDRSLESVADSRNDVGTPDIKDNEYFLERITSDGVRGIVLPWPYDPRKCGRDTLTDYAPHGSYDRLEEDMKNYPEWVWWRKYIKLKLPKNVYKRTYDCDLGAVSLGDFIIEKEWVRSAFAFNPRDPKYNGFFDTWLDDSNPLMAGFDISGGGEASEKEGARDATYTVYRQGIDLFGIEGVSKGDITKNLLASADQWLTQGVDHVTFDQSTVGLFIEGTLQEVKGVLPFSMLGVLGNSNIHIGFVTEDGLDPNKVYRNLRAFGYYHLARVLKNVHDLMTGNRHYTGFRKGELLSMYRISMNEAGRSEEDQEWLIKRLIGELSVFKKEEGARKAIESKRNLRVRNKKSGITSPDIGDAIMLLCMPVPPGIIQGFSGSGVRKHIVKMGRALPTDTFIVGYWEGSGVLINMRGGHFVVHAEAMGTTVKGVRNELYTSVGLTSAQMEATDKLWYVSEKAIFGAMDDGDFRKHRELRDAGIRVRYDFDHSDEDMYLRAGGLFDEGLLHIDISCYRLVGGLKMAGTTRKTNPVLGAFIEAMKTLKRRVEKKKREDTRAGMRSVMYSTVRTRGGGA